MGCFGQHAAMLGGLADGNTTHMSTLREGFRENGIRLRIFFWLEMDSTISGLDGTLWFKNLYSKGSEDILHT